MRKSAAFFPKTVILNKTKVGQRSLSKSFDVCQDLSLVVAYFQDFYFYNVPDIDEIPLF